MFHHSISYIMFTLITQLPYAFQPWLHGYKIHPFHQLCDRKNPSFCRMMAPVARRWGNSADASFSPSRTRMPPPVAPPTTCRWSKRFQSTKWLTRPVKGEKFMFLPPCHSVVDGLRLTLMARLSCWASQSAMKTRRLGRGKANDATLPRLDKMCFQVAGWFCQKSKKKDPSKGSIAMIANPFLGPFWCEQMIWCSSEWVLHAKISLECAKLWAKPIIKGCLQKSLHAIGFFSAMVMYHKSMEFLMTNETSRLRGGLNESQIIAPMATIHVIANGCSIPSKPFPPTIQIPDESLVKV